VIAVSIALGLFLNAAVGVFRLLEPRSAVAQAALTDVNLVQVAGRPLDVWNWDDGTASPRVILDTSVGGSIEFPVYVKIAP
jgi:hypothetical protein